MHHPSKRPPRLKKKRNSRKKLPKQVSVQQRFFKIATTPKRRPLPWCRLSKRPLRKRKKPRRNKRLSKQARLKPAMISVTIDACLRRLGSRPWKRRSSKRQTKPQELLKNLPPLPSSLRLPPQSKCNLRRLWLDRGPESRR